MKTITATRMDLTRLRHAMEPVWQRSFSREPASADYVDRLCLELCFRVAHECGLLDALPGSLPLLIERIGAPAEAHYFLATVLEILTEEGFVRRTAQVWECCKSVPLDGSAALQREARSVCPSTLATFELIERCCEHAPSFVTGHALALPVIFPRGDLELWERVHKTDAVMSIYADFIPVAIKVLVGPHARLLELGAGVGAVVQRCDNLLQQLDVAEYWFTDVGKGFLQNARRAFGREAAMRFASVDLNVPLATQGLAPDSFDAVIAVNVLHVARDLPAVLREIRQVLRTPGYLIGAEGSPPQATRRWRLDLVYGFLRGWWDVSTDPELRPAPGFLLPSQWGKTLLASGFDQVELLPGEEWFDGPCRGGLIVAAKLP